MIKIAGLEDVDVVMSMAKKFIDTTSYKDKVDDTILEGLVEHLIVSPRSVILLDDGKGMIAGKVTDFAFGYKTIATEIGWWVEPEHRKSEVGAGLLDAFEYWAYKMGCDMVSMVSLDNSVGKYYEKRGYVLAEQTYMKELK